MQQSDEYTLTGAHVSALTSVVQALLAHVLALGSTQEAADALVARLRRASRHVPRFVADDDQHGSPVSPYEEEIKACIGRIVDEAVVRQQRLGPKAAGTLLHLAGFTPQRLSPHEDRGLLRYGCGLTAEVARPTRRASELSRDEIVHAAAQLERKAHRFAPGTLAFRGKSAYSVITALPHVDWGRHLVSQLRQRELGVRVGRPDALALLRRQ
jgi:hypothetical protein